MFDWLHQHTPEATMLQRTSTLLRPSMERHQLYDGTANHSRTRRPSGRSILPPSARVFNGYFLPLQAHSGITADGVRLRRHSTDRQRRKHA